jgi:hypothetical protein
MLCVGHAALLGFASVPVQNQVQTAGYQKVAALASACVYRNIRNMTDLLGVDSPDFSDQSEECGMLNDEGWMLRNHYSVSTVFHNTSMGTITDVDNADIYTKSEMVSGSVHLTCLLAIQGPDGELISGPDESFITYQGLLQVHAGMVHELEGLLQAMEEMHGSLAATFSSCDSLVVAGHSGGASQAAIFAALANKNGDPRGIGKPVSDLQLLALPPVSNGVANQLTNDLSADGCFPGSAYFTSAPASDDLQGDLLIDTTPVTGFYGYDAQQQHIKIGWQEIDTSPSAGPTLSTATPCGSLPPSFSAVVANPSLLTASYATHMGPPHYLHNTVSYVAAFLTNQEAQLYRGGLWVD